METKNRVPGHICQSCSMPLDKPGLYGTEKDGTASKEYCLYCYRDGTFMNPGMTLPEMTKLVKEQMLKQKIDSRIISLAIETLPHLKRWEQHVVPA
jgi:radical SAM superfamily enzyme